MGTPNLSLAFSRTKLRRPAFSLLSATVSLYSALSSKHTSKFQSTLQHISNNEPAPPASEMPTATLPLPPLSDKSKMSSKKSPEVTVSALPLEKGTFSPALPTDLRSPCPLVNALANHGYIPRDGRNVLAADFLTALDEHIGLSRPLRDIFTLPCYFEDTHPRAAVPPTRRSWLELLLFYVRNPLAILMARLGVRSPGQIDASGRECLDLTQLALPGRVEHDISLTRGDYWQCADNNTLDPILVEELLAASADGEVLSMEEMAGVRRRRIEGQKLSNPGLCYGQVQHQQACGEIALILKVFGDGGRVSVDRVRALLLEERLPVEEGWVKRPWWWPLGLVELHLCSNKVKKIVGLKI